VLRAISDNEIDAAFLSLSQLRADALVVSSDTSFTARSAQLAAGMLRSGIPTIYQYREFPEAGGLIDSYRLVGIYAGRILKGDKPADLPVQLSTKVELVINLKAAKALGVSSPLGLIGRADEVIE
jgi:putative tryptophan/tyrosine transport system substrate-binding protein